MPSSPLGVYKPLVVRTCLPAKCRLYSLLRNKVTFLGTKPCHSAVTQDRFVNILEIHDSLRQLRKSRVGG